MSTPVSERGGTSAGINQMAKNYMQYNQGGSYDDDKYSLYALSNYGTDGGSIMVKEDPKILDTAAGLVKGRVMEASRRDPSRKPGFEVVNQQPAEIPQGVAQERGNYYACPVCQELANRACGCQYRDASCSKGHMWYMDNNRREMGISPGHLPPAPVRQVYADQRPSVSFRE